MTEEFYKKHRPKAFKSIRGQDDAVKMLTALLAKGKLPHSILLTGASGVGKTTVARILVDKLGCDPVDFEEINAAEQRGIDMIRDLQRKVGYAPLQGPCRVYLIDEVHQLVGTAQQSFLKLLEDTPKHVYFILATTDPNKLLKTIVTRCTEVKLAPLSPKCVGQVIADVAAKEKLEVGEEVLDRIVEYAEGSARKALVLLNQIADLQTEEEQLDCLAKSDSRQAAFSLCRALIDPRSAWSDVAAILKGLEEDPEGVRHMVLGYASTVLLGGGKMAGRAALITDRFQSPFYDSKRAGLILSCYEVVVLSKGGK